MNRYSLVFALLVASTFAIHAPQAVDSAQSGEAAKKVAGSARQSALEKEPGDFIAAFVKKANPGREQAPQLQVLFATVPHPIETHLAAAFDHDVAALQDGLQESGYLFDSSWIPWSIHDRRELFADDEKEKNAKDLEDKSPGILLFRKYGPPSESYSQGIVVFLLAEKPTAGIAVSQVTTAIDLMGKSHIGLSDPVRILGPNYSGSFASLVSVIRLLHVKNPAAEFVIRSGGVTGGDEAVRTISGLCNSQPTIRIDFGSAHHDFGDWIRPVLSTLSWMGIDGQRSAILEEDESLFGGMLRNYVSAHRQQISKTKKRDADADTALEGPWGLSFPRDISSLRAGYQEQGIFNAYSPAQPWKRFLNLKGNDRSEGDSVSSFGGAATIEAQESILFGISEFIKAHDIRAVIVSATNEEDRYFLTQFVHANDPGVRVVIVGGTRVFLRGSTAQFSGDMMVDDFPMLPRLQDWTGTRDDRSVRLFADSESQGTYFAAIDLMVAQPKNVPKNPGGMITTPRKWYPQYSEPNWNGTGTPVERPPMYIVALGGDATWPVTEGSWFPWTVLDPRVHSAWRVEMPFELFERSGEAVPGKAPSPVSIPVGRSWKVLFIVTLIVTVLYATFFFYADPVSRNAFASFAPSPEWRFWLFKVALPGAALGGAFRILAWAVEMPANASHAAVAWWRMAILLSALAPLEVAVAALVKAVVLVKLRWNHRMLIAFSTTALAVLVPGFFRIFSCDPFGGRDAGSLLNTYREMYIESGLSLVPTGLFLLGAFLVWATQAGNGAAVLAASPRLPDFHKNLRISQVRAEIIERIGKPLPFNREALWMWAVWISIVAALTAANLRFPPFLAITSLESYPTTVLFRGISAAIAALMLLDILQFLWLWSALRGLLSALARHGFKRSFVPITDFKWRNIWSFTGTSLQDRRPIVAAQNSCALDLAREHGFKALLPRAGALEQMRDFYNNVNLRGVSYEQFAQDGHLFREIMAEIGTRLSWLVESRTDTLPPSGVSADAEAIQRALVCGCKGDGGRFSDEAEELARLPEWRQMAEKLVCLMYIAFIQTVIARLHTLLFSVASMFSLLALGVAIYPFAPFTPLLMMGIALLLFIAGAFFKVFSEMDRDPILSRIVNGDDRKLQGSFYTKFAESLALPLLALASSLLPGGTSRLLEVVQAFLSHGQ